MLTLHATGEFVELKEFKELFRLLSEAPLQPYYRFLGNDFFNWIDQASRTE